MDRSFEPERQVEAPDQSPYLEGYLLSIYRFSIYLFLGRE
jgi:hypothetical protein